MRRLAAGGLVLLLAGSVGILVGYLVENALLFVLFNYCEGFAASAYPVWARSFWEHEAAFRAACMVLGGVGGILLGIWLIRRLFGAGRVR